MPKRAFIAEHSDGDIVFTTTGNGGLVKMELQPAHGSSDLPDAIITFNMNELDDLIEAAQEIRKEFP